MMTQSHLFNCFALSTFMGVLGGLAWMLLPGSHIPVGSLLDWLIGLASFGWLMVIVTLPWNVYFQAQQVIAEANTSQTQGIAVGAQQLDYLQKVSRLALIVAIALHFLSAVGLYALAAFGISAVGYVSSAATLLLTVLRPSIRGYQYLAERLSQIRLSVTYPREDVISLRHQVSELENRLKTLETSLDVTIPESWGFRQQQQGETTRLELARLQAVIEQLGAKNALEHELLAQQTQSAIAQLSEDSQFLQQVREIIRFWKTA